MATNPPPVHEALPVQTPPPIPAGWVPGMPAPPGYYYDIDPGSPGFGQLLPIIGQPGYPAPITVGGVPITPSPGGPSPTSPGGITSSPGPGGIPSPIPISGSAGGASGAGGVAVQPPVGGQFPIGTGKTVVGGDFSGMPAIPVDAQGNVRLADGSFVKADQLSTLPKEVQRVFVTQGFAAGQKAITDYNARQKQEFEANNVQLADGKWITKDSFNSLSPEYQNIAKTQGLDGLSAYVKATTIVLPDGTFSLESYTALPESYKTIANSQGLKAAYDKWNADTQDLARIEARTQFAANHVQLADGKWISNDVWDRLDPKYQDIGMTDGFRAMQQAINTDATRRAQVVQTADGKYVSSEYFDKLDPKYKDIAMTDGLKQMQVAINHDVQDQQNIIKSLDHYKSGGETVGVQVNPITGATRAGGGTTPVGYNITKYLLDNPDQIKNPSKLKAVGFSDDAIKAAQESAKATLDAVKAINNVLAGGKELSGEVSAITDAISNAGFYDPQKMNATLKQVGMTADTQWVDNDSGMMLTPKDIAQRQWDSLTEAQKQQVAGLYSDDPYKGNYFAEQTKVLQKVTQEGGLPMQLVTAPFLPIMSPIAKATTGQKVEPMEWAVAGATAALDLVSFGGVAGVAKGVLPKVVDIGLTTAAGGVFTKSTIDEIKANPNMPTNQKAFMIGMDTLIFASAGFGFRGIKSIDAQASALSAQRLVVDSIEPAKANRLQTILINLRNSVQTQNKASFVKAAQDLGKLSNELTDAETARLLKIKAQELETKADAYINVAKDVPQTANPVDAIQANRQQVSSMGDLLRQTREMKPLDAEYFRDTTGNLGETKPLKAGETDVGRVDVGEATIKDIEKGFVKPQEGSLKSLTQDFSIKEISSETISAEQNALLDAINRDNIALNRALQGAPSQLIADINERISGIVEGRMTAANAMRELGASHGAIPNEALTQQLMQRIADNTRRLGELRNVTPETLMSQFINKLRDLGYTEKQISAMSDKEIINIVSKDIKPVKIDLGGEPTNFPEKPAPEKGGGIATKEKTEVKTETEKQTLTQEELEQLLKKKTEEPKPEVKPETKVKTETPIRTDEIITSPSVQGEPYWGVVFEGGKVFVKLITPEVMQQGFISIQTKTGNVLFPQTELNRMTPEQAYRLYADVNDSPENYVSQQTVVLLNNQPQQKTAPSSQPQPQPQPEPQPSPVPQPTPQPQPEPQPSPQPTPTPGPSPSPSPIPEPQPQPQPQPLPQPAQPEPTKTIKAFKPKLKFPEIEQKRKEVKPGTIEWRQGLFWRFVEPPYTENDFHASKWPLPGTYKFAVGEGSARQTLQVLGGSPPEEVKGLDLGWAIINLKRKGRSGEMEVQYAEGADANVATIEERIAKGLPMPNEKWDEHYAQEAGHDVTYSEPVTEKIPRAATSNQSPPMGLQKVELPQYRTGRLKVFIVNGQYVRDNLDVNFTQGGHDRVYDYVPKNQIWLDRVLGLLDRKATLLHELKEREIMGNGVDYGIAHEQYANPLEIAARQNPATLDNAIAEQLAKLQTKPVQSEQQPIPVMIVNSEPAPKRQRKPRVKKESVEQPVRSMDLGERTYLGHRLTDRVSVA